MVTTPSEKQILSLRKVINNIAALFKGTFYAFSNI
jgi:hypothetical protein